MPGYEPQEWPALFEARINTGDLEGALALYHTDATFVRESGEALVSREKIRGVLAGLIAKKTRFRSSVVQAVVSCDTALLFTDFEGTMLDETGKSVQVFNKAIEVLRRSTDGNWLLVIGDPNGRK